MIELNKVYNEDCLETMKRMEDNSIDLIKHFDNLDIYKLTNQCNSAIARNLGFKKSKGEILFFIDGDMELIPENLFYFYNLGENKLNYPFISGGFRDYYYNKAGEFLSKQEYAPLKEDEFQVTTGGIFLINRSLWELNGGMRTVFRRSQDLDFGLRISARGIKLLRKKEIIANHHTINYESNERFWVDLVKGNFLYQGLLYKRNIFNKKIYQKYIRKEITLCVFVFVLILIIIFQKSIILLSLYGISLIVKMIYKKQKNMSCNVLKFFIIDMNTIISLLFFWPSPIKTNDYIKLK
jgi:glycosyltransferase involved in cell wall biosynthesis